MIILLCFKNTQKILDDNTQPTNRSRRLATDGGGACKVHISSVDLTDIFIQNDIFFNQFTLSKLG